MKGIVGFNSNPDRVESAFKQELITVCLCFVEHGFTCRAALAFSSHKFATSTSSLKHKMSAIPQAPIANLLLDRSLVS